MSCIAENIEEDGEYCSQPLELCSSGSIVMISLPIGDSYVKKFVVDFNLRNEGKDRTAIVVVDKSLVKNQ